MTAPIRWLALVLGVFLLASAPASATTATSFAGGTVTLDNDADSETFTVTVIRTDPGPTYDYRVVATNAPLGPPGGSGCANDGSKVLTCSSATVSAIVINGGAGDDRFSIGGYPYVGLSSPGVVLHGQAGSDTFTAAAGGRLDSNADGGPGDDTFNGSDVYADGFTAEPGNDTYRGGTRAVPAGADPAIYQLDAAEDSWYPGGGTGLTLSLDGVANDTDGLGGMDNLNDIEYLQGSLGNDTIIAGAGSVSIGSGDGDDTLVGSPQDDRLGPGGGSDTVRAGAGDDTIQDGDYDPAARRASDPTVAAGNDTIDGGDGDDVIMVGAGRDDIVGGPGTDTVTTRRLATQVFATTVPPDFEPTAAPVTITLDDQPDDGVTGSGEGDNIHADIENVEIDQGIGMLAMRSTRIAGGTIPAPSTVKGSAAANVIRTGGGNDTIDPGAGADTVDSGAGDDTINAVDQATDVIHCGRGTDTVGADLPGTNPGRADALTACENVTGTPLGLEGGSLPAAPTVTLGGAGTIRVRKFLRSYTVAADVTTDQPATGLGELTVKGARIAKVGALAIGSGRLRSGTGKRRLKVRVAVRYRKALKRKLRTSRQRRKGVRFALVVTVTNAAGQTTTATRAIRVKG